MNPEDIMVDNKTPIERAAQDVIDELPFNTEIIPDEIADIIRRRLEKEVPKQEMPTYAMTLYRADVEHECIKAHNQCRRDIGLRDEEETT